MAKSSKVSAPVQSSAMTPIHLDRAGVVDIYETLGSIKDSFDEVVYRWRAAVMRQQLKSFVDPIIEQRDAVSKLAPVKFQEDRAALCQRMSLKDAEGLPRIAGQVYLIDPAQKPDFDAALVTLTATHKATIDAFEAAIKSTNTFLEEVVELPTIATRLKLSWFNRSTRQDQLESLFPLIDCDIADDVIDSSVPKT